MLLRLKGAGRRRAPAGLRVARWLFGPVAWTGYIVAAALAATALAVRPDLRPSYEDAWFLGDPVLSLLCFLPIGLAVAAVHEAWHWLAGRALGLPATLRVGYRGIFLAFETDIPALSTVAPGRRYGVLFAGMAWDGCVLAGALLLRWGYRGELVGLPALADRLLGAVVLNQVVVIGMQCGAVFLRSDAYAILANALRCRDLYRVTWLTTKNRLVPLTATETQELAAAEPRDLAVARWFGAVYLAGAVIVCAVAIGLVLPVVVGLGQWVVANLARGSPATTAFWESVTVVAGLTAGWLTPPLLAWRERWIRRAEALRIRRAGVLRVRRAGALR